MHQLKSKREFELSKQVEVGLSVLIHCCMTHKCCISGSVRLHQTQLLPHKLAIQEKVAPADLLPSITKLKTGSISTLNFDERPQALIGPSTKEKSNVRKCGNVLTLNSHKTAEIFDPLSSRPYRWAEMFRSCTCRASLCRWDPP